tara:strand:+ start:462 stop:623 length:162 start_codon:yes stop_codon:yes gene_type:complete
MQELNQNEWNEIRFQISARIDFVEEVMEEYGPEDFYTKELKTLNSIIKKLGKN